jgi:phosphoribosylamine-glycine ligase
MKLLIVGGGGREHALAWKAIQSSLVERVYIAPGNAGSALEHNVENIDIGAEDIDSLLAFAEANGVGLTIVGPEAPLVAGIVDRFAAAGQIIFGPTANAAQLEGSKTFTKEFLARRLPELHRSRRGLRLCSPANYTDSHQGGRPGGRQGGHHRSQPRRGRRHDSRYARG